MRNFISTILRSLLTLVRDFDVTVVRENMHRVILETEEDEYWLYVTSDMAKVLTSLNIGDYQHVTFTAYDYNVDEWVEMNVKQSTASIVRMTVDSDSCCIYSDGSYKYEQE